MQKPVQGHFGNKDGAKGFSDPEAVDALEKTFREHGVPYELYRYENAGHAFMNPRPHIEGFMPNTYDPAVAKLAWERTRDFFVRTLVA